VSGAGDASEIVLSAAASAETRRGLIEY